MGAIRGGFVIYSFRSTYGAISQLELDSFDGIMNRVMRCVLCPFFVVLFAQMTFNSPVESYLFFLPTEYFFPR